MSFSSENHDPHKIPIIVSITGHRDAILTAESRECIDGFFSFLTRRVPATPIWVMSGLAAGADQFATEMALAWRDSGRHCDVKVIAVLPLEEGEYRKDFDEQEAQRFDSLCARVDSKFTLQPYCWPGADVEKIKLDDDPLVRATQPYSRERNAQYANLGAYLVRHANFLLALWDGCYRADSAGGTGDVVRFMLNGRMHWGQEVPPRPEFTPPSLLHGGELGVVAHVPVQRIKKPDEAAEDAASTLANTPPAGWSEDSALRFYHTSLQAGAASNEPQHFLQDYQMAEQEQLLAQLECYNHDIETRCTEPGTTLFAAREPFHERLNRAWLPLSEAAQATPNTHATVQMFRAADTLAMDYQRYMRRLIMLYMTLLSVAFVSYELVGFLSGDHSLFGVASFITFALSSLLLGAVYLYTRPKEYKSRFHKYRALAEALRIQFYLLFISDKATVERAFSGMHQRQFPWIAHSMRACTLFDWSVESAQESAGWEQRLSLVEQHWVDDQISYLNTKLFDRRGKGLKTRLRQLGGVTRALSGLAFVLMLAVTGIYAAEEIAASQWVTPDQFSWLMLLIVFLLGASGILTEWSTVNGYEEDINRFQDSLAAFNRTKLELSSGDPHHGREAMVNLSQHALHENTQWYDTHTRLDVDIAP